MLPLTSQERKVIICILALLIVGIGVDCLKKKTQQKSIVNYEALKDRLFDKVELNTATFSQLTNIPGVGEKLARAILDYRAAHGRFGDIETLKKVSGIKEKKLQQLEPYITVTNRGE